MNLFDVQKSYDKCKDADCMLLKQKFQSEIDSIEKERIETEIERILNSLSDNVVITIINKNTYEFNIKENLWCYLMQDNNEIVQFFVGLYIKQLALYKLSCREYAIPLTPTYDRQVQIIINHDGGNTIFLVTLNFLSCFNSYLLLNKQ